MSSDPRIPFGIAPPVYRLPDATTLGCVTLQVSRLERSLTYYRDVIGLAVLSQEAHRIALGVTTSEGGLPRVLIVLQERAGAAPVSRSGRLGLYHVAIVLPDRPSLGRFLTHLTQRDEHVGMADHYVSEALYLTDPDGLGLEVYADRPRETWKVLHDELSMGSVALDVRSLVSAGAGEPWHGAPPGTRVGHVHLHVGNLEQAAEFYHVTLGFDKIVWSYPGALFMSAGGYHHHLGTNTWARNASPAPLDEARLMEWTIVVPSRADIAAVAVSCAQRGVSVSLVSSVMRSTPVDAPDAIVIADPWGTMIRVTTADIGNHFS